MKRYGSEDRRRRSADGRKALAPAMALWCAAVAAAELRGQVTGVGPETYIGAVIVSPGNDAAVRSNAGNLTVRARIDPQLQNGHRLQLMLDGVPRGVARLTRIAHQLPAADADASRKRGRAVGMRGVPPRAPRLRAPSGRLDVLSSTPARPCGPRDHAGRRLDALATKVGERCGLVPAFELQNIDRGTHSLQLRILDNAGAVVFAGAPSTFHLLRHSRLHP